jgi:hypothetical protein
LPWKVALLTYSVKDFFRPGAYVKALEKLSLQPGVESDFYHMQNVVYLLTLLSYPGS